MARSYLPELRYSHLEDLRRVFSRTYEVDSATSAFERQVQTELADARTAHLHDELGRALTGYQRLQALILKTVNPSLPTAPSRDPGFRAPYGAGILDTIVTRSAAILKRTPTPIPALPPEIVDPVTLEAGVRKELDTALSGGLRRASEADQVALHMEYAAAAVERRDWTGAQAGYRAALEVAPRTDHVMQGYLLRDLAILEERTGDSATATELMERATSTFKQTDDTEGQVLSLTAFAGLLTRTGQQERAAKISAEADRLASKHGIHDIDIEFPERRVGLRGPIIESIDLTEGSRRPTIVKERIRVGSGLGGRVPLPRTSRRGADGADDADDADVAAESAAAAATADGSATLLALRYATVKIPASQVVLKTEAGLHTIDLDDTGQGIRDHLQLMSSTRDLSILHIQTHDPSVLIAYLPHLYFYVLPMSIGDTLASMGDFAEAERNYLVAASYPFLNVHAELPHVWNRLAELYVAWGDALYRQAGNDLGAAGPARDIYQRIVRDDNTIDAASKLFAGALSPMRARAQSIIDATDPGALDENPTMIGVILQARSRLAQIGAGLNFFGISPDYLPPFGFEHLQNTARFFAQHAAAIEQSYIQFKSQAENEEFRREQMEQQVELTQASVELERRGVAEAQAGERVAQQGLNYAETQRANAQQASDEFAAVRWDLYQLTQLEAWAGAQSVSADDEVRLRVPDSWSAYSTDSKRRSHVIQELAAKRTLIGHDMEASRLNREIASATAYRAVAQAQVAQARARIGVAEQRMAIAGLQVRQAAENLDFLDMKEFGARLWYELARSIRAISQRYLDMAIEVAVLMERAYEAETGRDLRKIRFGYRNPTTGGLLGADTLLADIDYFTLDYLTSTRTKKAPVKVTLSLADLYPMAFDTLRTNGTAFFETTLEQFDRMYPGHYLQKLQNVELTLVGVTGVGEVHGTLRNIGVSSFRDQSGEVRQQVYPADVMPLSRYDVRQDSLVFRIDPNELRLFENNGIATMWQLDIPPGSNDFDLDDVIDVQLVLCYDAFHDNELEAMVMAALPASSTASRSTSMRLVAPDELFYLRNAGEAEIAFPPGDFPRFQTSLVRRTSTLRVTGSTALVGGLTLRVTPESTATEIVVTTDADGFVAGAAAGDPLGDLIGEPVVDVWQLRVTAADNPGRTDDEGRVDLAGVTDVQVFQEYDFDYR